MISKKHVGIGAGIGVLLLLFGIFYLPPYQNGDQNIPNPVGEQVPDNAPPTDNTPTEDVPAVVTTVAPSQVDITDSVTVVTTTPVVDNTPSNGFQITSSPGHHHGGGGSNNNNNDDDNGSPDHETGSAVIRMSPEKISPGGSDVDVAAFGITDISAVTHVSFELCPVGSEDACTTQPDNTQLSPSTFTPSPSELECSTLGCEEYSTSFDKELLTTPGDYYIEATFYDADNHVLAVKGVNFNVPSMMVVPESPIGLIALFGSSLATLGAYVYYQRTYRK